MSNATRLRYVITLCLALLQSLSTLGAVESNRSPNITIFLTADQGYADVGVYGAQDISTPNIDHMAAKRHPFH